VEDTSATPQGVVNTPTSLYTRALYKVREIGNLLTRWENSQQMFKARLSSFARFNDNLRIAHDIIDYVKELLEKDTTSWRTIGNTYSHVPSGGIIDVYSYFRMSS